LEEKNCLFSETSKITSCFSHRDNKPIDINKYTGVALAALIDIIHSINHKVQAHECIILNVLKQALTFPRAMEH
jgi:hypothetical protein